MLAADGARLYKTQTFTSSAAGLPTSIASQHSQGICSRPGGDSNQRVRPDGASPLRGDSK